MSKDKTAQVNAGTAAVQNANEPTPDLVNNLKKAIPSAKDVRVNVGTDIWIDKATNVREIRDNYSDEELDLFSQTIRAAGGLLHPLILVAIADSDETDHKPYGLLDGFRRCLTLLRMAEQDNDPSWLENVAALVVDEADTTSAQIMLQLIVNLGRKGMTYMEQAKAIAQAMSENKELRQKDVAAMLGLREADVSKLLKLNRLPEEIQQKVQDGSISYSHAQVILYTVPESAWADVAKTAEEMVFSEFEQKMNKLYRSKTDATEATDEAAAEGTAGDGKGDDQQKRTTTLKATQVENTYIPFLRKELEAADKSTKAYTAADLVQARIDTLQTVTLKADTVLAKAIEPFIQEQQKAEAQEKVNKEANTKKEKFLHDMIKDVNAVLTAPPDLTNPNAPRPSLSDAFGAVIQKVIQMTDEQVTALGFTLDRDVQKLTNELSTAYMEDVKAKREEKAKKAKKKEEADAAEKAKGQGDAAATTSTASVSA